MKLIIGGSGFIGSAFRAHLAQQGQDYIAVTRKSFDLKNHMISREMFYSAKFSSKIRSATTLYYLASATAPRNCQSLPKEIEANVIEFQKYIEHAIALNSDLRIIYLSSGGQIYGTKVANLASEEQQLAPETPYAVGKAMIEESLRYFARKYSISYGILRPSNPIGPSQTNHGQGVIPALFNAAFNNTPFNVVGSLQSARDYVHVKDLCLAMSLADSTIHNDTWNVGSGKATTLEDIIKHIEQVSNKKIKINKSSRLNNYEMDRIALDTTKIRDNLGWTPQISLRQAVHECFCAHQKKTAAEKQLDLSVV
ncbi:NAD-dependent epimerase/dehydratase family protein [Microbulbifer hainanensis]|uniref:NAD-dependent epimerase/dehydratase family protein n=1 Tax=Microbulbifer hainanensis TaxID=2735675 RepID=UPI001865C69B|nr:NAD-dependent epimerase/dehydratase family protein [Microbulbifer hainanensis]